MANVKLLDWVMNHIEANQDLWDQNFWFTLNVNGFEGEELRQMILDDPNDPACDSAKCFAGWACTKEGWLPKFETDSFGGFTQRVGLVEKDGLVVDCAMKARELLDIDMPTGSKLFDADNDLDDLRSMVAYIKEHDNLNGWGNEDCNDCSGTGQVESECYACGNETTDECENCGGSGTVSRFD